MTIESLQDTATYDSKQKNMGFSADLDLAKGTGSSLSVNGGKTNLNSDYKAVGEQSGIFANEADLITQGKGTFKGGVFVTSKEAQANSNIVFKQGVTATDLKNTTSYDGDAIQAGISIGSTNNKPQASMNGIGYGTDSDSDSSITKGGVSGYNDPQGIFTTENREALAGKLENNFDAGQVNEELGAQTQITQAFDQERRKVKTELNAKEKKLRDEAEEARDIGEYEIAVEKARAAEKLQTQGLLFDAVSGAIYGPNSNGVTGYVAKSASPFVASQIGDYFKNQAFEQGGELTNTEQAGHILAHGILGAAISYATGNDAVTGGISAGAGEATAPLLSKFLYETTDPSKLTAEQKDTISAITSALGVGVGVTTGNASDAANAAETSKVAVENNSILFDDVRKWVDEIVNSSANTYKNSVVRNVVKGGGLAADGVLAVVDAFADSSVMAVHCTVGSKSACDTATEYNQARGVAIGQVLIKMGNGDTGRAIIKSYEDLASGDPAKVKKAQATQIQIFTSLGLSVKVGGNGTPIPIKKTSSTSAGKYSTSTTQAAQRAGSNHPLLEDAIPRNGSRLVVNQGQCPTCGPNSAKMVLDTLGKNVPIETLIKKSPMTDVGIYYTDVRNLLRSQGVDAVALPNRTVNDIARYTAKGTPVIVQIAGKNGFSHFVVVDGITKRYGKSVVAIRDPNNIQYFSPINTFESSFTGNTVIIRSK
jgi:filamentous hemagglutinin